MPLVGEAAEAATEPEPAFEGEGFQCPDCDRVLPTARGLNLHMLRKHGIRSEASTADSKSKPKPKSKSFGDKDFDELADRYHAHLTVIGTIVAAVMPHTGTTIVTRTPDQQRVITSADGVEHIIRQRGIVSVLMNAARKDERILKGLITLDKFMSSGDEIQLVGSLASAVAVDTGRIDPYEGIGVPGTPIRIAPYNFIPDVIDALAVSEAEAEAEHVASETEYNQNGTAPDGARVVHGGVTKT